MILGLDVITSGVSYGSLNVNKRIMADYEVDRAWVILKFFVLILIEAHQYIGNTRNWG